VPTGRLRITLQSGYHEGPVFEDRDTRALDTQLNRVFCGIYRQVVKAWREDRRHKAFHRELEEEARRAAEAERLKAERERLLAEDRARRRRLVSEANRWTQSKRLRQYVAHIRTLAAERSNASNELSEWMQWATSVAATLDPTDGRLAQTTPDSTGPGSK
jgi:hypothetical protein